MSIQNQKPPQLQNFLICLLGEIKRAREATSSYCVDHHSAAACGMVYAALTLDAINIKAFDRLSDLAIEAADYRRQERINNQSPYTWKPAKTKAQEASA